MRVGCVLIHNFAVQLVRKDKPELRGLPVIISGHPLAAKVVFDASPEAIACGVKVGMPLHEASSLCPDGTFMQADDVSYEDVFGQVLSILDGFSPRVETSGLSCAYLDLGGVKSEDEIAYEIKGSISSQIGLDARVGISGGKFFSWLAAFSARAEAPVIVSNGSESQFAAPFSINLLPCLDRTKERLKLFGIRMIGELAQFSEADLTAQFAKEGSILYQLAQGIDPSPLMPKKKPEVISEVTQLEPAAATYFELLLACEHTLDRLLRQAKARGKDCREVKLKLKFPSSAIQEKRLPLKEATSVKQSPVTRLKAWLEEVSISEGVDEVELSLILEPEGGRKVSLWFEQEGLRRELSRAASELRRRFGYQPIKKTVAVEPKPLLPERQFTLIDWD